MISLFGLSFLLFVLKLSTGTKFREFKMTRNPTLLEKKPRQLTCCKKFTPQQFLALQYLQTLEVVWRCSTFKLKLLYKNFPKKNFRGLIFTEWIKIKTNLLM